MRKIIFIILILCFPFEGESVFAKEPKRIASLAPSITESLYYLGLEEELVGVTSFCNYPEKAKQKEIIGTLVNPNIEKIFSLSPDLVLTVKGINRLQVIEKLKSLNLKVIVLDEPNNFNDICEDFIELGGLLGKKSEAEEIVREIKSEVNSIVERTERFSPKRVFWEVGSRPLFSVGNKSFVNEIIRYSGGANIFADSLVKYPRVSREEVIRRNPQVIILVNMGDVSEKERQYWRSFKDLEATKTGRIYIVNADNVCRPTPMSFLKGLKEVVRLLHPETFGEEY